MKNLLLSIFIGIAISITSHSQQQEQPDLNLIEGSLIGVTYELNEEGLVRVRSVGEADLSIGDRKDIRTATQKATLRAKGNIAKFLNEGIKTEEVSQTVEKILTSSHNTESDNNKEVNSNKKTDVTRNAIEDYIENISSNSEAILKGIVILKTEVNETKKYVQVEVGYSTKSQIAADSISKNLKSDTSVPSDKKTSSDADDSSNNKGVEIKKSANYDNF